MPTWGIVLSIVVYIGIGLGILSWAIPRGEEVGACDIIPLLLWPLVLIGGIVSWLLELMFGKY